MPGRRRKRGRRMGENPAPRRINRFVEPALLLLLYRKPTHGYGLMDGLSELGFDDYPLDYSGIYRILRGLEEAGMVSSDWDVEQSSGPPRRVYTVTPQGERYLAQWVEDLRATDRILHTFLDACESELEID